VTPQRVTRSTGIASGAPPRLGGTLREISVKEQMIHRGQMPEEPFVLVCQQYLADRSRSKGDTHPVYARAHVPPGYTGDAAQSPLRELEARRATRAAEQPPVPVSTRGVRSSSPAGGLRHCRTGAGVPETCRHPARKPRYEREQISRAALIEGVAGDLAGGVDGA
jgi:hypothetical protein